MAFNSLDGMKIVSNKTEETFIIGDYFAVYTTESTLPIIYNWSELEAVAETRTDFVVTTNEVVYKIDKGLIPDTNSLLTLRAIIEGSLADYPFIPYSHLKRILPPKNCYKSCNVPDNAYMATGVYNDKEISYSNVVLLNTRLGNLFIIVAVLAVIAVFVSCIIMVGNLAANWIYYLPISIFSGAIVSVFIYLACAIVAKYIYASLLKVDEAINVPITFVVCDEGFAAIESSLYRGTELIEWEQVAYFIETNYVFIIFKNKKAVFWLPKRLFSKEDQKNLSNYIAAKLHQK